MKAKLLVGLLLALVLGACPVVASFASGAETRGAHSCCPSDKAGKDQPAGMGAGHDCCIRVPSHSAVFLVAPEFHVVSIAPPAAPVLLLASASFSFDAADSSPPGAGIRELGSSPRSPPVPA